MKVNGDIFHNSPKNKSSNSSHNSSCTTNSIKCSKNFFSLSKDSKEPGSTCTQCNITFSDFQSKVNHTCMPYKCKICNTAFSFDFKLKMHKCNKRKSDKTETNKISPADSASSLSAELPDNENVSKKISKNCCRCGKKLSPRCCGILCRNCKSTGDKNKKSTLMCKKITSLSELSSNEEVSNSSETQDQIEVCNESTNILGESDDIITSSDVSDSLTSLPINVHKKKMRLSISEEIPKKYDSSKKKFSVAFKKDSDVSSTTDKHDILSVSCPVKKKRRVGSQSKGRKKAFSNNACSVSASKSITSSPSNNQISDSGKLTGDCKDKLLDSKASNGGNCRSLKVCLTSVLSENSVESNKDSASEICSNFDRGNVSAKDNITLSSDVSSGQKFEDIAVNEVGSLNISSKVENPLNLESESHIESRVGECSTSNDSIQDNVPETSKLQNSSSTGMNVFCKTRNSSIKKSKHKLNRPKLLSLEGKRVDTDNSGKHLECGSSQKKDVKSNVLIASLKNKRKASRRKFSSDMGYFKGRIYKRSSVKYKHNFSKKLSTITEESPTSLPSIQKNPKKVTFAECENSVTAGNSRCNEASVKTSIKDNVGKGRKRIFPFKVTSEEALLTESSQIVSTNTYNSSENRKLQTNHSNSDSPKSAYSLSDDPQQKRKYECKEKEANVSESINFGSLIKALPKNGIVLIKGSVNGRNIFKCPKCNYVYQQFQRATDHIRSCPFPKHKEKERKLLSDFEYVCSLCYQRWTSVDRLYKHYKQNLCPVSSMPEIQSRKMGNSSQKNRTLSGKKNSSSLISNYIDHFVRADKNHVCLKCNFSCLSLYTFNLHPCKRRRELMTKCIVEVKKLTKIDLAPFPNITNFECRYCREIFYDEMVYQNHCKKHSNVNRISERPQRYVNRENEKKMRRALSLSADCDTSDDISKRILSPIAKVISEIGTKNVELSGISLPPKQQKLFCEIVKNSVSDTVKEVFNFGDIASAFAGDLFGSDDSDGKDSVTSEDSSDFMCKCQENSDPNIEVKPCLKCLNKYVTNKMKENEDDAAQNAGNDTAVSSSSWEPIPSTSHSNCGTLAGSFSAALPNSSNASNDLCLTDIPVNSDILSAPSASAIDKSVIQTSDLGQSSMISISNSAVVSAFSEVIRNDSNASQETLNNENSPSAASVSQVNLNINISADITIRHELLEKYKNLGLSLPYLKVLCLFKASADLNIDEEIFCCTKLPPRIKDSFMASYKPVTIYKGIPEVLNEIHLNSKSDKIVFFVDIQSVEEITTKGTSVSPAKKEKLAFLESLLDVSTLTTLKSPLILDNETLDSIHNQHLAEYSFLNLDKKSSLANVRHLAYWDFDIVMETCIFHNNKFTVTFQVYPDNVTIILHWDFDNKKDYDVYVSKAPRQYVCAECLDDFPLSLLIEHVTDLHKNSVINIHIL